MAAAGAAGELEAGRVVAGRYRIEGLLGRGGMGRVYRAVDEQLGRAVALKVLAVARDGSVPPEEAARRMLREARSAAAFSHANAVAVFDVGEFEGAPFIAMELVRGRTLRETIGDTTVGVRERLRWLGDVARALAAAHRAGLVHRDVKPDNVIVGDDGVVKLLDFGIARRLPGPINPAAATERDGTITVEGTLVGTPAYMAPEQLRGEKVDGRADQFAWAVMAFELLAGTKPWPTANAAELIAAVLSKPAPPLVVAGVPAHVTAAIARALAKPPGDCFVSMDALIAALDDGGASARERPRLPLVWLIGGVGALAALAVVVGAVRRHASPAKLEVPMATSPAGTAPVRFLCAGIRRASSRATTASGRGAIATATFSPAAARELVAVGHDGMCACPRGGSTHGGSCPSAMHSSDDYRNYLASAATRAARRCPGGAGVRFFIRVDPDGRAFDARIDGGATADVAAQRCVVDALSKLELDPPPNGLAGIGLRPGED